MRLFNKVKIFVVLFNIIIIKLFINLLKKSLFNLFKIEKKLKGTIRGLKV
jgi:hypothetical protein